MARAAAMSKPAQDALRWYVRCLHSVLSAMADCHAAALTQTSVSESAAVQDAAEREPARWL